MTSVARPNAGDVFSPCIPTRVAALVERSSRTTEPVLLLGETGSGKSFLARLIHQSGPRKHAPFVDINCASLPSGLFERELFGHVAGAYTDARSAAVGLFEAAGGGSLFLDEIAELADHSQAALLGAIEQRAIRKLGSARSVPVDVRIIAATNQPVAGRQSVRSLRPDLFFRLSAFVITLPPLRDRLDDLPAIAEAILRGSKDTAKVCKISERAMRILRAYDWPGNIRELEHVIKQSAANADDVVDAEHLPEAIGASVSETERCQKRSGFLAAGLEDQAEMIRSALTVAGGNRLLAAKALGISRSTLWLKLRFISLQGRGDWHL